jgi:hypothetical protein
VERRKWERQQDGFVPESLASEWWGRKFNFKHSPAVERQLAVCLFCLLLLCVGLAAVLGLAGSRSSSVCIVFTMAAMQSSLAILLWSRCTPH